ncbi:hypothetical protein [Brevundimonas sp.]|uniref:hypothetical protein n=1 Tax=Brevundimonas sp. TaxID=1871086 RepID=UPI0028A85C72|nr:hypothetical protein [Brevundimonas sp.]
MTSKHTRSALEEARAKQDAAEAAHNAPLLVKIGKAVDDPAVVAALAVIAEAGDDLVGDRLRQSIVAIPRMFEGVRRIVAASAKTDA